MNVPSARTYAGWLALVRILTGVIWLTHARSEISSTAQRSCRRTASLSPRICRWVWRKRPVRITISSSNVVAPNARALCRTRARRRARWSGIFACLRSLHASRRVLRSRFAAQLHGGARRVEHVSGWGSIDACIALLSAISLVLPTGRIAGFDGLRGQRAPRRKVVNAEVVPERPLDGPTAPR